MKTDKISLYYCSGNSDKEYHASIEPKGDGFIVSFAFGRRGNSLQTGCKTQEPVPYAKAKAIFDKLVQEKTAKGYTPGQSGTPYQATPSEQRVSGILPQLLNPVEEDEAERLIADNRHWMQQKFDGKRVLIEKKQNGEIIGINRKGLTIALPVPIAAGCGSFPAAVVIDGESCGDAFHAFDLLSMNGIGLRELSYGERLGQLENLVGGGRMSAIRLVKTAKDKSEKAQLFERLQQEQAEGVVFKRHDAPYLPGRPASGGSQLKFKFYATASCLVAKINAKRSVSLELLDEGGKRIGVGNVTIPANQPVPKTGAVIEVRYLYFFPQGALFQPTCLGQRDDIETAACVLSQLKFKPEAADEDDA